MARALALANESVTDLTSTPAKVPAMKKRDKRAREVLELIPVTPNCPQATIAPSFCRVRNVTCNVNRN
jgi:hypothetical protein